MPNLRIANLSPNARVGNVLPNMRLGAGDTSKITRRAVAGQPIGLLLILTYSSNALLRGITGQKPYMKISNI